MSNENKSSISLRAAKAMGKSVFFSAKVTGKAGWAIGKLVGRQTGKLAAKGA